MALLHAEAGHLDRTAAHFAETLRLKPGSAAAHYNLGNVLFRQGRRAEAIDHFRNALALMPDYAPAHDALGVAVFTEGKVGEAIEHYLRALAFDPGNADAHHHVAVALRSLGRLADAIPHYRQVLQIDPDRQDVKTELAAVERQLAAEPSCAADARAVRTAASVWLEPLKTGVQIGTARLQAMPVKSSGSIAAQFNFLEPRRKSRGSHPKRIEKSNPREHTSSRIQVCPRIPRRYHEFTRFYDGLLSQGRTYVQAAAETARCRRAPGRAEDGCRAECDRRRRA